MLETLSVYIIEIFEVVEFDGEEVLLNKLETMTVPILVEF